MSRTVETTVYQYAELSPQAQGVARDHYRDNVEFLSEYVIEDAKAVADILGISIDNSYWSGFNSQGDGACFTGSYRYAKNAAKLIAAHAPQDAELLRIAEALQDVQRKNFYRLEAVSETGRTRYSNEWSVSITTSYHHSERETSEAVHKELSEALRDFMRWIYKQLEAEYEYQMSDDAVIESINADCCEFNAEGRIV